MTCKKLKNQKATAPKQTGTKKPSLLGWA
ncbi:uncharacterized protein METZ01_LOCUS464981, partial [marine metagenome]